MRWFKKTFEVAYSEEFAPYILRELADCRWNYKVRWASQELVSYRPFEVYTSWTMHLTFPDTETGRLLLSAMRNEAAKKVWADDDRRRDAQDKQK